MSAITIQTTRVYSELEKAFQAGYTTISAHGGARSSKTYNIIIWLINKCIERPMLRVSIVRGTLPALKGSVYVDFKEILMRMQIFDERLLNKSELTYQFSNGSWIEFFSCDSEQKLRGRKRDILFVNEANELTFYEWQQLKMRTTVCSIIDYNPSFTDEHWINKLNREEKTYHFVTTYKDNPFLEQRIIDELESLKDKSQTLWKIYGLGEMAEIEGKIFKNVTVIDSVPYTGGVHWVGMDFGYSTDPTAIVLVALDENGKNLYIDEICYKTKMLTSDIIKVLKRLAEGTEVIAECAEPRLIDEIYNGGINIFPVKKYPGSVMAGIMKMMEYTLCVTKRSYNILKEFRNYVYAQDKEGRWLNKPIDSYNHAIDAIRYVVLDKLLGESPEDETDYEEIGRAAY